MAAFASQADGTTPVRAAVIRWLDAPREAEDSSALGGKAAPLARLLAAGLPVPPGFVITPDAFPSAPAPNGARDGAQTELAGDVRRQVRAAYAELARRLGEEAPLVAVRSSATAEDLAGASFAGQYETFLGVRGADAVAGYAGRCWASLWSPHAVAYRQAAEQRLGRPLPVPAMAVLVQGLIPAEAAGVAFTADPVTGAHEAVTINAAWGLGQSVVDGEVEADTWRVDRQTLSVVQQTTGRKATRSGLGPDAPRVSVPAPRQRLPCLTPEQVVRVAELALRAEAVIAAPADAEWALEGETLWLLQARPITTLPLTEPETSGATEAAAPGAATDAVGAAAGDPPAGPTPRFPFAWPDEAAPARHWTLRTIDQRHIEAMRSLEIDVRRRFYRSLRLAAEIKGAEKAAHALHLNGYEYVAQVPLPYSPGERERRQDAFRRPAAALVERGENYFHAVVEPEVDAGNARLAAVAVDTLDPAALAAHLEDALDWYERSWTLHWLWPESGPNERFFEAYKEVTGDASRAAAAELTAHEPNLLTDAIDRLLDLAATVQRHAPLRALFLSCSPADVLERLSVPDRVAGGDELMAKLDELLQKQGLRCGAGFGTEQNQCLPGWREDPALVAGVVQRYVPQDLVAIRGARAAAVARRDARVEAIRATIADAETRRRFDFWLESARRGQQAFEDHNYKIDSAASSLLHSAIAGCARRLVAAGRLRDVAEIWWLEAHEVALAVRGLVADGAPAPAPAREPEWPQLVAARQALHRWRRSLTPPATLGAPPQPADQPRPQPAAPAAGAEKPAPPADVLLTGQSGSAGVATGRVRLTDRNASVPDVGPGEVLVARNAGPLWTPVFPAVAAVVLDEGVLFQHAMLTCREYGVPAVFQTKTATQVLREGQRVTVDATHGWVLPAPDDQRSASGATGAPPAGGDSDR
jgi:pyruvate,water dikinase